MLSSIEPESELALLSALAMVRRVWGQSAYVSCCQQLIPRSLSVWEVVVVASS